MADESLPCEPPSLSQGVAQFNQGEFYACHDTFEALWTEAMDPDRTFYQGLLQIAVGLYHLSNRNWKGAVILMGEGCGRLQRYGPTYAAVDVAGLLDQTRSLLQALQHAGPEQLDPWLQVRPQIHMHPLG